MPSKKELFLRHLGQTSQSPTGLEIERAKGIYLFDYQGKDYIDLVSGVSVSNLGHCHPKITEAITEQSQKYMHLMVYGEMVQEPQVNFARLLNEHTPASLESVYLVNSGSEAIEGALKLAKRYTGREEIIACRNAYHGGTHGALSLYSDEKLKNAFRPLLPGVSFIGFNEESDLGKITEATACVVMEPVQGEGGVIVPQNDYLKKVRERCDETGTLLIFDEIQTGFGRCGELFAFLKYGVVPDILAMAKAMGGGMPIGGFMSSHKIMHTLTHDPMLGHITTFGGHPVSAAAAYANLQELTADQSELIHSAEAKAQRFMSNLKSHPLIKGFRHSGLLIAVELGDAEKAISLSSILVENGIISDMFLYSDTAFRISPPLIINEAEIDEASDRIIKSLNQL